MPQLESNTPIKYSFAEIAKHNTPNSAWVIIHGKVYDVTSFAQRHPGGADAILEFAGTDATAAFDSVHHTGLLEKYFVPIGDAPPAVAPRTTSLLTVQKPPLNRILSARDFEAVAAETFSPKAWAFISSAATDCITHSQLNPGFFSRIMLRPRVLRDVTECDIRSTMLGLHTEAPFFIAPTAMQKLVHPLGETELSRGAGMGGLIMGISNYSSFPLKEIMATAIPGQHHILQLYVHRDHSKVLTLLKHAKEYGFKAVFVTVDAPVIGKREADEKVVTTTKIVMAEVKDQSTKSDKRGGGLGRLMGQSVDSSLTWKDLKWIKEAAGGMPIVCKGIQTAVDAMRAVEAGASAIYLTNHGGRSLDTSPPAILTLLEIHKTCPEILNKCEIYVDGGVKRGTDIFKALCLGAKAVGIGRPYLYALNYGAEGVDHLTDILKDELMTTMRMCGVTKLSELHPGLVNTGDIDKFVCSQLENHEWIQWRRKAARL